MSTSRNLLLGLLCGLVAGAFWGGVFLAPKLLAAFTPLQMTAGRYIAYGLASAVLLIPTWKAVMRKMDGRDWRDLVLLSLLGNLIYYVGLSVSVQSSGVALASLVIGLLPVTVTLVGAHSKKGGSGEGVQLGQLAAPLALIVAGGVCINVSVFTDGQGVGIGKQVVGLLGALLALAMWTAYAVWNARRLAATPKFTSHEWSLLTGLATGLLSLLLVVPAFVASGEVHAAADWRWFWMVSFAVAIGASVIGNGLWNSASRLLPLSLSGQLIVFETLFALLYGFLHEGRWPRGLEATAIVLMLAGVLWSARLHRPAAHPA